MERIVRGHHLLCVHGFRGMGYSPDFIKNMDQLVTNIRDEKKDFMIKVVAAFDDACVACPHKGMTECEANEGSNQHVLSMDGKVIAHLGLEPERAYRKSDLVALTAGKVQPADLDYLCAGCSWLSYGVCKQGIQELKKRIQQSAE